MSIAKLYIEKGDVFLAYTETTSRSWFSRIGDSFKGIVFGLVLICAGTVLLYWNEGNKVKTGDAINEAKSAVVVVKDTSKVDPTLDGKFIHATGRAETKDTLTDSAFGQSIVALHLNRSVEFYQWVEKSHSETRKKLGGGEETITTYTYEQQWVPQPVESTNFKDPAFHSRNGENFVQMNVEDFSVDAKNVTFGGYKMPSFLSGRIRKSTPLNVNLPIQVKQAIFKNTRTGSQSQTGISSSPTTTMGMGGMSGINGAFSTSLAETFITAAADTIYIGRNSTQPQIGDVRVKFSYVQPTAEVTIDARVIKDTFEPFQSSNGKSLSYLTSGTVSVDKVFADATSSNETMAWVWRIIGVLVVTAGFRAILGPLSVLADVLPFLGNLVGAGTGIVGFLLGLAWSLVIIAFAWLRFRPLIGGGLLAIVVVLLALVYMRGHKKGAAPAA